ncbi:MAG: DUF1648 domain-containing protein [Ferruginibacter sp.]
MSRYKYPAFANTRPLCTIRTQADIIEMETRPKIKLTLSKLDKNLELTGKIFLVVMWGLTLYTFLKLPTTIPIHFNASGKADSYGNKLTLLILPVLGTVIYVGLTQLNKYPQLFNYMTKINEDNAERQYSIATRMLRFLKLAILVIFSLIILFTYLTTIGLTNGLGSWFLPLTIGLLLIPVIISIRQSFKKKNNVV